MTQLVRFTHNTTNPRLRYTVAYSFDKNADGSLNITYGISQCRRTDTFSRAEGRKVAEARLNKALSGKAPAPFTHTSRARVPLYGKMTVQDYNGLSVGKIISEDFEKTRLEALKWNSAFDRTEPNARDFLNSLGFFNA